MGSISLNGAETPCNILIRCATSRSKYAMFGIVALLGNRSESSTNLLYIQKLDLEYVQLKEERGNEEASMALGESSLLI